MEYLRQSTQDDSGVIPNGTRCSDKAYIVMIGMTGTGKSTTMNMLFDRKDVGNNSKIFRSDTQEIIEYEIAVPALKGKPSQLLVIDTPGFRDTRELDYKTKDAKIMATTQQYIMDHKDLQTAYPTAVLLVANFTDHTVEDEKSYFIQFLTGLESMIKNYVFIDTGSATCNLILVLTHFMNAEESDRNNPESRIRAFLGLIKTFTTIPSNITVVLAENKGSDFKLDECNGYYKLPTGDSYPYNLYNAIQNVAKRANDDLGASIIGDAFRDSLNLKKERANKTSLVDDENSEYLRFLYMLRKEIVTKIQETEMTGLLQDAWDKLSLNETKYHGLALQIAKSVFVREKIDSQIDLPTTIGETLALIRQLPLNSSLEKVLKKVGVSPPTLRTITKSAGYFYNVISDTVSNSMPFMIDANEITQSGFAAPPYILVDLVNNKSDKVLVQVSIHGSREDYVTDRLRRIGAAFDTGKQSNFVAANMPGHNINQNNVDEITGIKEFREYSVTLTKDFKLLPHYVEEFKGKTAYNSREFNLWHNHFTKFGSHVLKFGFLGGSVVLRANRIGESTTCAKLPDVVAYIEAILTELGESEQEKVPNAPHGWNCTLEFYGGDQNLTNGVVERAFGSAGRRKILKWIESLKIQPTFLFSQIQVEHVSHYIKKFHYKESEVVSHAAYELRGFARYVDTERPVQRKEVTRRCVFL